MNGSEIEYITFPLHTIYHYSVICSLYRIRIATQNSSFANPKWVTLEDCALLRRDDLVGSKELISTNNAVLVETINLF